MLKVAIALGLAIICGATGDILFSVGMRSMGEVKVRHLSDLPGLMKTVFTHPIVLLGVFSMAGYFGCYIAALVWVDVSVANPLTALSYLIATGYAIIALRERVSPVRAMGVVCIVLGAIFVGLSS